MKHLVSGEHYHLGWPGVVVVLTLGLEDRRSTIVLMTKVMGIQMSSC